MASDSNKRRAGALAIAVALAAPAEGLRQKAYLDPVGLPTICFGSTKNVHIGDTATVEQCKQMLSAEMLEAIEQVDRCQPGLPVKVLAAFADATYNMGPTIACDTKNSTAARMLKAGSISDACNQLKRWDKAKVAGVMISLPGLTKRRAAETEVCLDGVRENLNPETK